MAHDLSGKKIAILATDGFEQVELTGPRDALRQAGAEVHIVSPKGGRDTDIRGWENGEWGDSIRVDLAVADADPADFDGLVLPGGVINPDRLRRDPAAVAFVRRFFVDGKTVAAICHGPWMVAEAGAAEGRRLTSFHSIRTDMRNAGATWVDEPVVEDRGLITSRNPGDIPAFNERILEAFQAESAAT